MTWTTCAPFASSANNQIGVGQLAGVEILADHLFGHLVGWNLVGNDPAKGIDDLGTSAIVKGKVHGNARVVLGHFQRMTNLLLQVGVNAIHAPAVQNAHAIAVQIAQLPFDSQPQ